VWGLVNDLEKFISEHKWLLTVGLFGFLLVKVVVISRWNIQTALGVFSSAGATTVLVGGILSSFPLVAALALGAALLQLSRRFRFRTVFPSRKNVRSTHGITSPVRGLSTAIYDKAAWLVALIAAAFCFFLTPWPIVAMSAGLGIIAGQLIRPRCTPSPATGVMIPKPRRVRIPLFIATLVLLAAAILLIIYPLLYAVWLPHETLVLSKPECQTHSTYGKTNAPSVTGFVLDDSNGWASVLRTHQRTICRIKSEEVRWRILCQGQIIALPLPYIGSWYKRTASIEVLINRQAQTALPNC
jgi:hypothetical protein